MYWKAPDTPPGHNFTLVSYTVKYWHMIEKNKVHIINISNATVTWHRATGLDKWSLYLVKIFYIGREYTLQSRFGTIRTGEASE